MTPAQQNRVERLIASLEARQAVPYGPGGREMGVPLSARELDDVFELWRAYVAVTKEG